MTDISPPIWATAIPNFPVHNAQAFTAGSSVPVMSWQQAQAAFEVITNFFIGQIAIAFGGIEILGWHPFEFLATWGENLQAQSLAAYQGQEQANTDIATLLDGVLGTGHTIQDLADFIAEISTLLPIADFNALRDAIANALGHAGSGFSTGDVQTILTSTYTQIIAAGTAIASLISGVGGATITDVVSAISDGVTALTRITTLISGVGGAAIGDVVTAINSATTQLSALITGVSGTTIADVTAAINNATSKLTSLISGIPGATTITDVVHAINTASANAQGLIDALLNVASNGSSTGGSVSAVLASLQNSLRGLLPAVIDRFDGTAQDLFGVTFNGDGTATYTESLGSVYSLIDNLDGTATTVAKTLANMANTATSLSTGVTGALAGGAQSALNFAALLANTAQTDIASLATLISNAASGAISAIAQLNSLIAGVGGATITDVVTAISNTTTAISSLISGVSGLSITDVVTAINDAASKLASLITGSGSATVENTVQYGATGIGNTAGPGGGSSFNWNHVIGVTDTALVTAVSVWSTTASPTVTVQCGSTPLTQLGATTSYYSTGGYFASVFLFGLIDPPTDSQTISVTTSAGPSVGCSTSYRNVASFGSLASNAGSGTSLAISVPSASNRRIVQTFAGFTSNITSYSQAQRYNAGFVNTVNLAFAMGDAPGASSTNFSASTAVSNSWAALAVPLIPTTSIVSTITAVVDAINTAASNAQGIIDALINLGSNGASTGGLVASVFGSLQSALRGLLPAVIDNLDGTATGVYGITANGDGTALFTPAVGSFYSLIDNLDGTVTTLADTVLNMASGASGLATGLTATVAGSVTAANNLATLISGVGVSTITGVVTAINDATAALTALISGVGGTVIADVVNAINAATSKLSSLISGVSGSTITDVVTAINNGVTAFSRVTSLISGVTGGSTITDVVTAINAATSNFASLISGVSGSTITDVVNTINNAVSNVQGLIDALINLGVNGVGSGGAVGAVLGILRTTFSGLLPAVRDNFDGTAQDLSGVTYNGDGTATFTPSISSVYNLVDNLDGTATSVAKTLLNMSSAASSLGTGVTGALAGGAQSVINFANLLSSTAQTDIAGLASLISNAAASAASAISQLTSLITGIGGATISDVVTAISNASTAISSLISGVSGSTITDVVTAINAATSNFASLISGVSGSTITDVSTAISSAGTNAQNTIDSLVQLATATSGTGHLATEIKTNLQNALVGILPAVVDNLDGTAAALSGIVFNGDGTANYTPQIGANPVYTLIDNIDGTATTVAKTLQNMANTASGIQKGLAKTIHNTQATIDGLVNNFLGTANNGNEVTSANLAVASQSSTTTANSSQISNINSILAQAGGAGGGVSGGLNGTVNFGNYSDGSLPAVFTGGSGIQVASGLAVCQVGVGGTANYQTVTTTDYQKISVVLGALNQTTSDPATALYIIGRSNGTNSYVGVQIGTTFVSLFCLVSGVSTSLKTVVHTPINGATYTLQLGDPSLGNTYQLAVLCNGTTILTYSDGGHISQVGASYRTGGFLMGPGSGSNIPAALSAFGLVDNPPPSLIGSGFLAYRAATGAYSWSGTAAITNCFDTVQRITSDLSFNTSTGELTIGISGWYDIKGLLTLSSGALKSALYKNSTLIRRGGAGSYASNVNCVAGGWSEYLAAGDVIQLGNADGSSGGITGDASGTATWFSVSLTNRGTLS